MRKSLNWQTFALVSVLILAAFFRLYRIADYMTFLGDEGRDVLVAYQILHGQLTLLGPTASVGGFFLGPIYYYFMTPFLWLFNYHPVGPAVMVALFGIATVYLVYKIGSEFFNKNVGLIAAFFYAISPLTIAYSRSSWNPNLMPFFSLLTLYVLYKALVKNNIALLVFCGFLLGITMQLHYLATFLGVIIAVYTVLIRKSFSRAIRDYLFIFVGFVLGWSPFLAFEIRHGFSNLQSIFSFIFDSKETGANSHFFQTIYDVFLRLFGRLVTSFPPGDQIAAGLHKNAPVWQLVTFLLGALSFTAIFRSKGSPKRDLLLVWLIVGIALFGFYKNPIYDYYFGFMFVLPFLFVGFFLFSLFSQPKFRTLSVAIFITLILLSLSGIPFRFQANRQVAQVRQISQFVLEKAGDKPFNFAIIAGGNSDHAYRYFFKILGKDPVKIETLINDPARKTVTDQLLVVCETISLCHPLGYSSWEVAGFGRAEITDSWDVSVVKVVKLKHYANESNSEKPL